MEQNSNKNNNKNTVKLNSDTDVIKNSNSKNTVGVTMDVIVADKVNLSPSSEPKVLLRTTSEQTLPICETNQILKNSAQSSKKDGLSLNHNISVNTENNSTKKIQVNHLKSFNKISEEESAMLEKNEIVKDNGIETIISNSKVSTGISDEINTFDEMSVNNNAATQLIQKEGAKKELLQKLSNLLSNSSKKKVLSMNKKTVDIEQLESREIKQSKRKEVEQPKINEMEQPKMKEIEQPKVYEIELPIKIENRKKQSKVKNLHSKTNPLLSKEELLKSVESSIVKTLDSSEQQCIVEQGDFADHSITATKIKQKDPFNNDKNEVTCKRNEIKLEKKCDSKKSRDSGKYDEKHSRKREPSNTIVTSPESKRYKEKETFSRDEERKYSHIPTSNKNMNKSRSRSPQKKYSENDKKELVGSTIQENLNDINETCDVDKDNDNIGQLRMKENVKLKTQNESNNDIDITSETEKPNSVRITAMENSIKTDAKVVGSITAEVKISDMAALKAIQMDHQRASELKKWFSSSANDPTLKEHTTKNWISSSASDPTLNEHTAKVLTSDNISNQIDFLKVSEALKTLSSRSTQGIPVDNSTNENALMNSGSASTSNMDTELRDETISRKRIMKESVIKTFKEDATNITTTVKLLLRKRPHLENELTGACKDVLLELSNNVKKKISEYKE